MPRSSRAWRRRRDEIPAKRRAAASTSRVEAMVRRRVRRQLVAGAVVAVAVAVAAAVAAAGGPQDVARDILDRGPGFLQRLLEVLKVYPWAGPAVIITALVVWILRSWPTRGQR